MRLPLLLLVLVGCGAPKPADDPKPIPQPKAEEPKPGALDRAKSTRPGADWPTFLGPTRDGVSTEKGILTSWPKAGLKKLWDCDLGQGYAPPVVADGKLYHFDRFGDAARLTTRNAETGEFLWKYEYPTEYEDQYGYDPGPRACPVVDGDRVYLHGADGILACVSTTGKEVWKVDTKAKYHVHQNFFGAGSVPLVVDDLLIVPLGGSPKGAKPFDFRDVKGDGSGFVAFDKKTGAEKYKSTDELASYSSPVLTELHGKKTVVYFARAALVGIDPTNGKERFRFPWRAKSLESVNAANPVVVGNQILVTECYEKGAALVEITPDFKAKEVWSDKDPDKDEKSLMAHWSTPVLDGKYVYGCSGRHTPEGDIRCVELATGAVKWKQTKTYRVTFTKIDGHILALGEDGTLTLFKPNPDKFERVEQWKEVPELEYPCWAPPVVSHGLLYLRGKGKLACYELVPKK